MSSGASGKMSVASGSGIKKKAPKKLVTQRNTARNEVERLMANKKKLVKALDKHEAKIELGED